MDLDRDRAGDGCAYGRLEELDGHGTLALEIGGVARGGGGEEPPILPAHRLMQWALVLMGCWPGGRGWVYLLWSLLVGLSYPACMAVDIWWWLRDGIGPTASPDYLHAVRAGEQVYFAQMFVAYVVTWRLLRDREAERQVRAALANERLVADWWFRFGCLLAIFYLAYAGYIYFTIIQRCFGRGDLSRVAFMLFIYVYNCQFVASALLFVVCALSVRDRIIRFVEPPASSGEWRIGRLRNEFEAVCGELEAIGNRFNLYLSACNGATLLRYGAFMATPLKFIGSSTFQSEAQMLLRVAIMVGFIDFAGARVSSAARRLQPRLVHWRDPCLADEAEFPGMPAKTPRPTLKPLAGSGGASGSFGAISATSREAPPSASLVGPPPAGTAASVASEVTDPPCTNTSMAAVAAYASGKMLRISHEQQLLLHTCTVLENREFKSLKILGVALSRRNLLRFAYIIFGLSVKFGLGKALVNK